MNINRMFSQVTHFWFKISSIMILFPPASSVDLWTNVHFPWEPFHLFIEFNSLKILRFLLSFCFIINTLSSILCFHDDGFLIQKLQGFFDWSEGRRVLFFIKFGLFIRLIYWMGLVDMFELQRIKQIENPRSQKGVEQRKTH